MIKQWRGDDYNEVIGPRDNMRDVSAVQATEPTKRASAGDDAVLSGQGDVC